ncbi:MAG: zf-HC2 domain-containing protein [Thermoleophilia bacterium]
MLMGVLPRNCERARSRASLHLDDELSELEESMLVGHLAKCASCAAFASELSAITNALRFAPLEQIPAPVALPPARRVAGRFVQTAAAAAVALLAVGLGTLLSPTSGTESLRTAASQARSGVLLEGSYDDEARGLPRHPLVSFRSRASREQGRSNL